MIAKAPQQALGCMARVTFWDEDGNRVPAIDQHGRKYWGGDWQPNMITDVGLDQIAEPGISPTNTGSNPGHMRHWMALDDASTEIKDKSGSVTASQAGTAVTASAAFFSSADVARAIVFADGSNARITAFVSATEVTVDKIQAVASQAFERWHVERATLHSPRFWSSNNEGFHTPSTFESDLHDFIIHANMTRVCTLTSDRNLTGYGFAPTSGGQIGVMELFRDAQGNAITLSLTAGKKVRVDHRITVRSAKGPHEHAWQVDEYDAADELVDTQTLTADCYPYLDPSGSLLDASNALLPSGAPGNSVFRRSAGITVDPDAELPSVPKQLSSQYGRGSYVPGARRRVTTWLLTAAELNGAYHGVHMGVSVTGGSIPTGASRAGYAIAFRDGTFEKLNTHTLQVGYELSWDRDYASYD